jgi:hypothetical protein
MPIRVQAYTLGGIVTGVSERPGHLREILESSTDLELADAQSGMLDGSAGGTGQVEIPMDDLVLAVGDEESPAPVHASWHPIRIEAGPWLLEGELPTMPGFDPGRALTRPTGTFVLLRDAKVRLLEQPDAGENTHDAVFVNRYTVDRVDADLMLGFFFPGAHIAATALPDVPETVPTAAAGAYDAPELDPEVSAAAS